MGNLNVSLIAHIVIPFFIPENKKINKFLNQF